MHWIFYMQLVFFVLMFLVKNRLHGCFRMKAAIPLGKKAEPAKEE